MKSNYKRLLEIEGLEEYNEFISFAVEALFSNEPVINTDFMKIMYGKDCVYEDEINKLQIAFIAIMKRLSNYEKITKVVGNRE